MSPEVKLRVGVIFGGRSGEHEVSLMSARSVLGAIDRQKYTVVEIGISHQGGWLVGKNVLEAFLREDTASLEPAVLFADPTRSGIYRLQADQQAEILQQISDLDVIFPVLHGTFGEDGTLQGLLELADVAYVGAGVVGSAVGMDKGVFKDVMRANGIPVVDSILVLRSEIEADLKLVVKRAEALGEYPLFTKPANLGSSVGISRCASRGDLVEGLLEAARFDRRILVEVGVRQAREIEVSVLGNDQPVASVPGEVVPSRDYYSYEAKYIDGTSRLFIPASIPEPMTQQVQELAVRAYKAIDCAGMARVDFLLESRVDDKPNALYLNEVNTIPGFTQISMYPKLWEASGLPYSELIDRLIELGLDRKAQRDRTERRFWARE